jgi:hypothetical protein
MIPALVVVEENTNSAVFQKEANKTLGQPFLMGVLVKLCSWHGCNANKVIFPRQRLLAISLFKFLPIMLVH